MSSFLWNWDWWLGRQVSWKDIDAHAKSEDLWTYPFLIAFALIIFRFQIFNKYFVRKLACFAGLKHKKYCLPPYNIHLEKLYSCYKLNPPMVELKECSVQLNWNTRQIEYWLKQRCNVNNMYAKFGECCWSLLYYSTIFCYGVIVMRQKPWLYDIKLCFIGYPDHNISNDIWWYYMIELAYYWSMIITYYLEPKRKDFWQMFLHHIITILLITFSWACNVVRIGTIILIIHDCSDIPLLSAKLAVYLKKQKLSGILFSIFACVWVITRLILYPLVIINICLQLDRSLSAAPISYLFIGLLLFLQLMHLVWSYFICKIALKMITAGKICDVRSDSESSDNDKTN